MCAHRIAGVAGIFIAAALAAQPYSFAAGGPTITTPYDTIPDFGASATIHSVKTGNWSDPTVWSANRSPAAGDVVQITANTTVTYDLNNSATVALKVVSVEAGGVLTFLNNATPLSIKAATYVVKPGGSFLAGTPAAPLPPFVGGQDNSMLNIVTANQSIDTVNDPNAYGTGFICLGTCHLYGTLKTPFMRLANEPKKGDTTLSLSGPVSGWNAGDELVLPDSRHLLDNQYWSNYVPQWEVAFIKAISGNTVTLTAALQYGHPGARDGNGVLTFSPHAVNLTRPIMFESENPLGTRGHTLFTYRADVDIEGTGWCEMGRAQSNTDLPRYPVYLRHLFGPSTPAGSGSQFIFKNDSIDDDDPSLTAPSTHIWAFVLEDSHFGLIQDTCIYNSHGAGMITLAGNESYNVIDGNFITAVMGDGNQRDNTTGQGMDGMGFWLASGWNNYIRNNVAASCLSTFQGIVSGAGFKFYGPAATLGVNVNIPVHPGDDPNVSGQNVLMQQIPMLQFDHNESYGAIAAGLTIWNLGTDGYTFNANMPESYVTNFNCWNFWEEGYFAYPVQNITFDGYVLRGDPQAMNNFYGGPTGWVSGDYFAANVTIKNADIQSVGSFLDSSSCTVGKFTIQNSYSRTFTTAINIRSFDTGGSGAPMLPRTTVVDNVKIDPWPGQPWSTISKYLYNDSRGANSFIQKDELFVYSYNQVAGANFEIFDKTEQNASFVLDSSFVTTNGGAWPGNVGITPADVGLTNQQLAAKYPNGLTVDGFLYPVPVVSGKIAPYNDTTTHPEIDGCVCTFPPPTVSSPPAPDSNPIVAGQLTSFSAGATDPMGGTVSYLWNFGDGGTATGGLVSHTFNSAGTYSLTVTISTSSGGSTTITQTLTVVAASSGGGGGGGGSNGSGGGTGGSGTGGAGGTGGGSGGGGGGNSPLAMTVSKAQGAVKFTGGHDTCTFSGAIPNVAAGFAPTGQSVTVTFSGASSTFSLNRSGSGRNGSGSISLKFKLTKTGKKSKPAFGGGHVPFTIKLQHGAWAALWGFNPATSLSNARQSYAVAVVLGGNAYATTITATCSSKAHVSGKFKM